MKLFFCFLLLIFTFCPSWASDWTNVKAANGKTALLDTENISVKNNYASYWVKSSKNGYTYKYYMLSDCSQGASCIVQTYKYDSKGNLLASKDNGVNLEKIMPDSLNEQLYKNVCEYLSKNPMSIDSKIWETYFQSVNSQIKKDWKPEYAKTSQERLTTSLKIKINSDGSVVDKNIINKTNNEQFDNSVNAVMENIKNFQPLPENFKGVLECNINFNYIIKGDELSDSYSMDQNGAVTLNIYKAKVSIGKAIGNGLGFIICLPLVLLGALL